MQAVLKDLAMEHNSPTAEDNRGNVADCRICRLCLVVMALLSRKLKTARASARESIPRQSSPSAATPLANRLYARWVLLPSLYFLLRTLRSLTHVESCLAVIRKTLGVHVGSRGACVAKRLCGFQAQCTCSHSSSPQNVFLRLRYTLLLSLYWTNSHSP